MKGLTLTFSRFFQLQTQGMTHELNVKCEEPISLVYINQEEVRIIFSLTHFYKQCLIHLNLQNKCKKRKLNDDEKEQTDYVNSENLEKINCKNRP